MDQQTTKTEFYNPDTNPIIPDICTTKSPKPKKVVQTIKVGRFHIVQIEDETGIRAIGIARKGFKDKDNPTLGEQIAEGRAYKALNLKRQGKQVREWCMG